LVESEFGDVGFCGERKTREPREKPSEQGKNQQQTQPTYIVWHWVRIEPGPHWWEANTLTAVPSLRPCQINKIILKT